MLPVAFPRFHREESFVPDSGEEVLLARLREGDRAAAEELVELTYKNVYAAVFRLCGGNGDLAADLTQETYRKAWEALATFEGRARLGTWLFRIAYTTFINHVRRPQRIVPLDETTSAEAFEDPGPSAFDMVSQSEDSARLRAAVLELPEDLRFTVTAHYWSGVGIPEIARSEGITAVAIRKRLKKALGLLQSVLREDPS